MATVTLRAPGGAAAEEFLMERFGLQWGDDVYGIQENGFTAEYLDGDTGVFKLTLVGRCTREDVERFVALLWSKPEEEPQ